MTYSVVAVLLAALNKSDQCSVTERLDSCFPVMQVFVSFFFVILCTIAPAFRDSSCVRDSDSTYEQMNLASVMLIKGKLYPP